MMSNNTLTSVSIEKPLCKRDRPAYMQVLINLEYRKLLGYAMHRASREVEGTWAKDLAYRLNKCLEKPTLHDMHLLCDYISALQYDGFKTIPFTPEFKEHIALIIKDYLLSYEEREEYKTYAQNFALQCEKR